ncbi:hypothetical protein ACHAW5_011328 [Stephanodiscus triporus]|uniref:Uncharacterized protein n=1 Tax=Stephanodiscus triporus TaxID=2934178 RepID=A0ABD3QQZ1_9STRA
MRGRGSSSAAAAAAAAFRSQPSSWPLDLRTSSSSSSPAAHYSSSAVFSLPRSPRRTSYVFKNDGVDDDDDGFVDGVIDFLFDFPSSLFDPVSEGFRRSFPPPDDSIVLSGDVVALLVYTYLDHITNSMVIEANSAAEVAELVAPTQRGGGVGGGAMLPVWFDGSNLLDHGRQWLSHPIDPGAPYAPAVAAPGPAFVVVASCWLLCGLAAGAFRRENTIRDPSRALVVTLRAWCVAAPLVVAIALGSDGCLGGGDDDYDYDWRGIAPATTGIVRRAGPPVLDYGTYYSDDLRREALRSYLAGGDGHARLGVSPRGGLTRADADYIFDSLSVLAFWRLAYNWMSGYRR